MDQNKLSNLLIMELSHHDIFLYDDDEAYVLSYAIKDIKNNKRFYSCS